jgi:putative transposase
MRAKKLLAEEMLDAAGLRELLSKKWARRQARRGGAPAGDDGPVGAAGLFNRHLHRLCREEGLAVRKRRARPRPGAFGCRSWGKQGRMRAGRWISSMTGLPTDGASISSTSSTTSPRNAWARSRIPRSQERRVTREVTAIVERRGKPGSMVSDGGTEFTCNAMLAWCKESGIDWHFHRPRLADRERLRESFNGRMRDEFLKETLFFDIDDARTKVAMWVADYNGERPHSSLQYLAPAAYAATLTATGARLRNPDELRRIAVLNPRQVAYKTLRL